jgi:hypothetical protein
VEGRDVNVWDKIKIDLESFRKAWIGLIWHGIGTGGGLFGHGTVLRGVTSLRLVSWLVGWLVSWLLRQLSQ